MSEWPKNDGETYWACCVSAIGPQCQHVTHLLVHESTVRDALATDVPPSTLEDYDDTVLTLFHNGDHWTVHSDSETVVSAREWVLKARAYGEQCGYFVWYRP